MAWGKGHHRISDGGGGILKILLKRITVGHFIILILIFSFMVQSIVYTLFYIKMLLQG